MSCPLIQTFWQEVALYWAQNNGKTSPTPHGVGIIQQCSTLPSVYKIWQTLDQKTGSNSLENNSTPMVNNKLSVCNFSESKSTLYLPYGLVRNFNKKESKYGIFFKIWLPLQYIHFNIVWHRNLNRTPTSPGNISDHSHPRSHHVNRLLANQWWAKCFAEFRLENDAHRLYLVNKFDTCQKQFVAHRLQSILANLCSFRIFLRSEMGQIPSSLLAAHLPISHFSVRPF